MRCGQVALRAGCAARLPCQFLVWRRVVLCGPTDALCVRGAVHCEQRLLAAILPLLLRHAPEFIAHAFWHVILFPRNSRNNASTSIWTGGNRSTVNIKHPVGVRPRQDAPFFRLRFQWGIGVIVTHDAWRGDTYVCFRKYHPSRACVVLAAAVRNVVDPRIIGKSWRRLYKLITLAGKV